MYRLREFPEIGDLVVCSVTEVQKFGAFVTLDEYGGRTGFIHISEVASGWIKHMSDFIRTGQKVVCKVLHVDPVKGHIDLSLKQVNEHQKREKIKAWKDEQRAEKLFEIVAKNLSMNLESCYRDFGCKLIEKFGSMHNAFESCARNPQALQKHGFRGNWIEQFVKVAQENIVLPTVEIDGILNLRCYLPDGIDCIKKALSEALENTPEETSSKIQYIGAPRYRIVVSGPDYKAAEAAMKKISDSAVSKIEKLGGEGSFIREKK